MRVAIATDSKYEFIQFRKILKDNYTLTDIDEKIDGNMRIGIYTTRDSDFASMLKMFKIIENITGANPLRCREKYNRLHKRAHIIAAVILRDRYGWNYSKIARLFGYKDHASISEWARHIRIGNIKNIPLELAVRNINAKYNK